MISVKKVIDKIKYALTNLFSNKEKEPFVFQYDKTIYLHMFSSEHELSLKASLALVKKLIKISTDYNMADNINSSQIDHSYALDIAKFLHDNNLNKKVYSVKKLVSWLHYWDDVKKDFFHYDQTLVMYYVEQVNMLMSIYATERDGEFNSPIAGLISVLEHFQNSSKSIESYIEKQYIEESEK